MPWQINSACSAGVCTVLLCLALPLQAGKRLSPLPHKIEIFHTNETSPTQVASLEKAGVVMVLYNMDAHTNLEKALSEGLPVDNMALAEQQVRERVKAAQAEGKFDTLFHGAVLGRRYDLKKVPALVFDDGASVIYGMTDMLDALTLWQSAQAAEEE